MPRRSDVRPVRRSVVGVSGRARRERLRSGADVDQDQVGVAGGGQRRAGRPAANDRMNHRRGDRGLPGGHALGNHATVGHEHHDPSRPGARRERPLNGAKPAGKILETSVTAGRLGQAFEMATRRLAMRRGLIRDRQRCRSRRGQVPGVLQVTSPFREPRVYRVKVNHKITSSSQTVRVAAEIGNREDDAIPTAMPKRCSATRPIRSPALMMKIRAWIIGVKLPVPPRPRDETIRMAS